MDVKQLLETLLQVHFIQRHSLLNFVLELKNCSKREPGFERCQCLQEMNESNLVKVKVKYANSLKERPHI